MPPVPTISEPLLLTLIVPELLNLEPSPVTVTTLPDPVSDPMLRLPIELKAPPLSTVKVLSDEPWAPTKLPTEDPFAVREELLPVMSTELPPALLFPPVTPT